jgi:hypothetical protein
MSEFFDQRTGEEDRNEVSVLDAPTEGASILINGSFQRVEVGAPFLQTVKNAALSAGFGKFRTFVNHVEVRPTTAPTVFQADHKVELRPYDEAGFCWVV